MLPERPDLNHIDSQIRDYIEALETELARFRKGDHRKPDKTPREPVEYTEPPTTINLVTISQLGLIKRTPRHHYTRQRRGGMGVFDLSIPENDSPAHILTVDEDEYLLLLTDFGRGYRLPLSNISKSEIRSRGQTITELVDLIGNETIVAVVPGKEDGNLALLSQNGYVRLLRHNYVGLSMRSGTSLLDVGRFGPVAAAGWLTSDDDVFIATRNGIGIRFQGKKVSTSGSLGIRLENGDVVAAVCGTNDEGSIFLMGADGKGTIRKMEGFRANKAPGAGGKVAMKTDKLIGAVSVDGTEDLFIVSQLSKIIRFQAEEIPQKTGVVQGVNCISLRADEAVAIATS